MCLPSFNQMSSSVEMPSLVQVSSLFDVFPTRDAFPHQRISTDLSSQASSFSPTIGCLHQGNLPGSL